MSQFFSPEQGLQYDSTISLGKVRCILLKILASFCFNAPGIISYYRFLYLLILIDFLCIWKVRKFMLTLLTCSTVNKLLQVWHDKHPWPQSPAKKTTCLYCFAMLWLLNAGICLCDIFLFSVLCIVFRTEYNSRKGSTYLFTQDIQHKGYCFCQPLK